MIQPELQEKIEQITNLPTLPSVASRLMKLVNNPNTSIGEIAYVVGQDLSLAAKVLRLSNSAFYGIPRTITTINNAIAILGLKVINTLVLSLTVFDMFPEDRSAVFFNRKKFWTHSLGCGMIAKLLTMRLGPTMPVDSEEAFCAGLLHDMGKVVMEQYLHADFQQALRHAIKQKIPLHVAEQQILGFTHTDVAGWLTARWELPPQLQIPLMYHHAPKHSPDYAPVACLCHYADALCYQTGLGLEESFTGPAVDPFCSATLPVSDAILADIKAAIVPEIKKLELFYAIARG